MPQLSEMFDEAAANTSKVGRTALDRWGDVDYIARSRRLVDCLAISEGQFDPRRGENQS